MPSIVLLLLPLVIVSIAAHAVNDWGKPCHNGECFYSLPTSQESMAAIVRIEGAPSAISDITNAAGWEILECTPNTLSQNVRLVCLDDDSICSHIFQDGAEHTIVRLPEHCGKGPFVRISKAWISENQSIPSSVVARMKKRRRGWPSVHALSLDSDFGNAFESNKGNVSITVYASTTRFQHVLRARRAADSASEDFDIFPSFSSKSGLGPFVRNTTQNAIPFNVNNSFNIVNTSIPCSEGTESTFSVDADIDLQGEVNLGIVAQGTIIPPKFEEFGIFAALSADLAGRISISTNISGEINTPEVPILNIGLPALSVPGIVSLGPSISLKAKASVDMDVNFDLAVGIGYSIQDLTVFFPPSQGHNSSAVVVPKDIPFGLSISPDTQASTSFTAHLIPSLNLGLVAFDLSTAAFLEFDSSATLALDLNAATNETIDAIAAPDALAEVDGCVGMNGGIAVKVGLEAGSPIFDLLGNSTTITLVQKHFDFLKQCFPYVSNQSTTRIASQNSSTGVFSSTRRHIQVPSNPFSVFNNTGLSCLSGNGKKPITIVNKTLSVSSFKAN